MHLDPGKAIDVASRYFPDMEPKLPYLGFKPMIWALEAAVLECCSYHLDSAVFDPVTFNYAVSLV